MKNIQELPIVRKDGFLSCSISEDGKGQYKGQKNEGCRTFQGLILGKKYDSF